MLMIANWKMNMSRKEIVAYLDTLAGEDRWGVWNEREIRLVLCPPFPYLDLLRKECVRRDLPFGIMAQNMAAFDTGPFTGEVSAGMLRDVAAEGVLLGHSERRQYFGETDADVTRKIERALAFGLVPVVCFGETQEERDRGDASVVWSRQIAPVWEAVGRDRAEGRATPVYWAYEPVWAIGTGRAAGLADVREVSRHLRKTFGKECARGLLYGGSVNAESVTSLFEKETVRGFLVGGAFLDARTVLCIFDRLFGRES